MHKHDEFTTATANIQCATLQMTNCYRLRSLWTQFMICENCESVESCGNVRGNEISASLSFPYKTRKHLDYVYRYCIRYGDLMCNQHNSSADPVVSRTQNYAEGRSSCRLLCDIRSPVGSDSGMRALYAKHSAVVRCPGHANWRMRQTCTGRGPEEHRAEGIQMVFGENFWLGIGDWEKKVSHLDSVFKAFKQNNGNILSSMYSKIMQSNVMAEGFAWKHRARKYL